jgi:hypothetical protein
MWVRLKQRAGTAKVVGQKVRNGMVIRSRGAFLNSHSGPVFVSWSGYSGDWSLFISSPLIVAKID